MARRALGLGPLALAVLAFACAGLKRADEPADAGASDAGALEGVASPGDAASADTASRGASPPPDFACDEPWFTVTKRKPECAPRQVRLVEPTSPLDVKGISIARTPAGRVGIAYNAEQGADTGELHLAHFTPTAPSFAAPALIVRSTGFAFHDGYLTRLAASAPDTLALLSYDMDDGARAGDVHLRELVAAKEPLTDALVVTGVQAPTELGLGGDLAGNLYASVRIGTGQSAAKLAAYRRPAAGGVVALPDLTAGLVPASAPGIGAASIFVEASGQAHLLFQYNEPLIAPFQSMPRYHTLAGTVWTDRKTVDNNAGDGLSGFSPRIATFGTKKFAAYFFRKAQQPFPATAELRLATWEGATDTPQLEIVDQQLPSGDTLYPAYRVAMAVDRFGLVHLAIVRPGTQTTGSLEYRRQTRGPGGTTWLRDIVDGDIFSGLAQPLVDLVVDEVGRPHIAYVSGKDGLVRYATRFDR
jgi:hypothetical protein